MIRVGDHKGFTLIELIIFIIIGGIFLPVSMIAFTAAMKSAAQPDQYVKARFYAEQKMEELTSYRYSDPILNVTGGTINDTSPPAGYQRSWSVCYVPSNNIDYTFCDIAIDTYYKKITVTIAPTGYTDNYVVSTIITKRPKS